MALLALTSDHHIGRDFIVQISKIIKSDPVKVKLPWQLKQLM